MANTLSTNDRQQAQAILERLREQGANTVESILEGLRRERAEAERRNSGILEEARRESLDIYDRMSSVASNMNNIGISNLFQFTNHIRESFTGIGDSLRDSIPEEVKNGFGKISSTVGSNVSSVLGSGINNLFSDVKNLMSGARDIFMGDFKKISGLFGVGEEDDDLSRFESKVLKLLNNFDRRQRREERDRARPTPSSPDDDGLLMPLVLAGAFIGIIAGGIISLIGGIGKSFLIPFEIAYKTFM